MIDERLLLLDSSSDSDLDDALLLEVLDRQDIQYRAQLYGNFNLENYNNAECKLYFRFEKNHLRRLAEALRIPNNVITQSNHNVSGVEGLCILLRRSVKRFLDLLREFIVESMTKTKTITENFKNRPQQKIGYVDCICHLPLSLWLCIPSVSYRHLSVTITINDSSNVKVVK